MQIKYGELDKLLPIYSDLSIHSIIEKRCMEYSGV